MSGVAETSSSDPPPESEPEPVAGCSTQQPRKNEAPNQKPKRTKKTMARSRGKKRQTPTPEKDLKYVWTRFQNCALAMAAMHNNEDWDIVTELMKKLDKDQAELFTPQSCAFQLKKILATVGTTEPIEPNETPHAVAIRVLKEQCLRAHTESTVCWKEEVEYLYSMKDLDRLESDTHIEDAELNQMVIDTMYDGEGAESDSESTQAMIKVRLKVLAGEPVTSSSADTSTEGESEWEEVPACAPSVDNEEDDLTNIVLDEMPALDQDDFRSVLDDVQSEVPDYSCSSNGASVPAEVNPVKVEQLIESDSHELPPDQNIEPGSENSLPIDADGKESLASESINDEIEIGPTEPIDSEAKTAEPNVELPVDIPTIVMSNEGNTAQVNVDESEMPSATEKTEDEVEQDEQEPVRLRKKKAGKARKKKKLSQTKGAKDRRVKQELLKREASEKALKVDLKCSAKYIPADEPSPSTVVLNGSGADRELGHESTHAPKRPASTEASPHKSNPSAAEQFFATEKRHIRIVLTRIRTPGSSTAKSVPDSVNEKTAVKEPPVKSAPGKPKTKKKVNHKILPPNPPPEIHSSVSPALVVNDNVIELVPQSFRTTRRRYSARLSHSEPKFSRQRFTVTPAVENNVKDDRPKVENEVQKLSTVPVSPVSLKSPGEVKEALLATAQPSTVTPAVENVKDDRPKVENEVQELSTVPVSPVSLKSPGEVKEDLLATPQPSTVTPAVENNVKDDRPKVENEVQEFSTVPVSCVSLKSAGEVKEALLATPQPSTVTPAVENNVKDDRSKVENEVQEFSTVPVSRVSLKSPGEVKEALLATPQPSTVTPAVENNVKDDRPKVENEVQEFSTVPVSPVSLKSPGEVKEALLATPQPSTVTPAVENNVNDDRPKVENEVQELSTVPVSPVSLKSPGEVKEALLVTPHPSTVTPAVENNVKDDRHKVENEVQELSTVPVSPVSLKSPGDVKEALLATKIGTMLAKGAGKFFDDIIYSDDLVVSVSPTKEILPVITTGISTSEIIETIEAEVTENTEVEDEAENQVVVTEIAVEKGDIETKDDIEIAAENKDTKSLANIAITDIETKNKDAQSQEDIAEITSENTDSEHQAEITEIAAENNVAKSHAAITGIATENNEVEFQAEITEKAAENDGAEIVAENNEANSIVKIRAENKRVLGSRGSLVEPEGLNPEDKGDEPKKKESRHRRKQKKPSMTSSQNVSDKDIWHKDSESEKKFRIQIRNVHELITGHRYANTFRTAVLDSVAHGYSTAVKKPINMKSVKRSIETGLIRTTCAYEREMSLMCLNAMVYNPESSDIHRRARDMTLEAESRINEYKSTLALMDKTKMNKMAAEAAGVSPTDGDGRNTRLSTSPLQPEARPRIKRVRARPRKASPISTPIKRKKRHASTQDQEAAGEPESSLEPEVKKPRKWAISGKSKKRRRTSVSKAKKKPETDSDYEPAEEAGGSKRKRKGVQKRARGKYRRK